MWQNFVTLYIITHLIVGKATIKQNDVIFQLYTRKNPDSHIILSNEVLGDVEIDISNKIKFIIHDFLDDANVSWIQEMKNKFLSKGDYNIVTVDWSKACGKNYNKAAPNTKDVGTYLAKLIIDLQMSLGLVYEDVHLLGHGLGAHVCGFAGKHLFDNEHEKIARITGMNPSGPLFNGNNPKDRLNIGDAHFVDVIHTSVNLDGYKDPCGHVDFFPNGGLSPQPGCLNKKRRKRNYEFTNSCSHSRSYIYQTESINSYKFVAILCSNYENYKNGLCNKNSTTLMGENVHISTRGSYYLNTNNKYPYGKE